MNIIFSTKERCTRTALIFMSICFLFFGLSVAYADSSLKWTTAKKSITIENGGFGSVEVSATGANDIEITCSNCQKVVISNQINGKATLTWDTSSQPTQVGNYNVSIKATDKNDSSQYITDVIKFSIVEQGTPVWVDVPQKVYVEIGKVGVASVKVDRESIISCNPTPCLSFISVVNQGGGQANVLIDTNKLPPYSQVLPIGLTAQAMNLKTSNSQISFNIVDPGIPTWKSVPEVEVELGEIGEAIVEANTGVDVKIQCASCLTGETVVDLGAGKGLVKLDTKTLPQIPTVHPVSVKVVNTKDPEKFTIADVRFVLKNNIESSGNVKQQNYNTDKLEIVDPTFIETTGLNQLGTTDVKEVIGRMIRLATGIIGTIALVMIIYGGGLWMTAAGSSEKEGKAMKIMFTAGIGVVIILSSYAIVTFVFSVVK